MYKIILLISFTVITLAAAAQEDTVWKDNNLVGHFDEHYCVLKSNKKLSRALISYIILASQLPWVSIIRASVQASGNFIAMAR